MKKAHLASFIFGLFIMTLIATSASGETLKETFSGFGSYSKAKEWKAETERKLTESGYTILSSVFDGELLDKAHSVSIHYVAKVPGASATGPKGQKDTTLEVSTAIKMPRNSFYLRKDEVRQRIAMDSAKEWIDTTRAALEDRGASILKVGAWVDVNDAETNDKNALSEVEVKVFIQYLPKIQASEDVFKKLETLSVLMNQIPDADTKKLAKSLIEEIVSSLK